jgi:hypothetical protein
MANVAFIIWALSPASSLMASFAFIIWTVSLGRPRVRIWANIFLLLVLVRPLVEDLSSWWGTGQTKRAILALFRRDSILPPPSFVVDLGCDWRIAKVKVH